MVRRNVPLERKLIEQRGLFDLTMSHHDLQSCLLQRLNQRTSCVATEDFFNKIGHQPTSEVRDFGSGPSAGTHDAQEGGDLRNSQSAERARSGASRYSLLTSRC